MASALLAATWGNPLAWRPARYRYGGAEAEARTSLEAVAKRLQKEGRDVHVLILVSNTLANTAPRGCDCTRDLDRWPPGLRSSYTETVEAIRGAIAEWIERCSCAKALRELLGNGRLRVEVLHGHGFFDRTRYLAACSKASPMEIYRAEAMAHLASMLTTVEAEELVVDLTHGINYMPTALLEAARTAALAYAVAEEKTLSLTVVNSEPYPLGATGVPELEVYTVEHTVYDARGTEKGSPAVDEAAQKLRRVAGAALNKKPYCIAQAQSRPLDELKKLKELRDKLRELEEKIIPGGIASANIALYAMPLAALYQAAEPPEQPWSQALEFLHRLLEEINARTRVEVQHRVVEPRVLPEPVVVEAALLGAALHQRLKHAAEPIAGRDIAEEGASLEELKTVLSHLGSLYEAIAKAELGNLKHRCEEKMECAIVTCPERYPDLGCGKRGESSMDHRNLKAHAGLERNIVEARLVDGRLWLRYRRGCWEMLEKDHLSEPGF